MASVPDVAPFLRRPRLGSTPKVHPVMKLEWGKLLAEATEKDTELEKESVDKEGYCDDDFYEVEFEGETENSINNGENDGEKPLNLCSKSHTMPSLVNQLQNSLDVLDLSSGKKPVESDINRTPMSTVKQKYCTAPVFQLNEGYIPNSKNECDKKITIEPIIENKENIPNNKNIKNVFSTPCNKANYQERYGKQLDGTEKNKNNTKDDYKNMKQNLIFFSEKKPPSSNISVDKVKPVIEETYKNKSDVASKKEKSLQNEKINGNFKVHTSVQSKPLQTPQTNQSENFAVPAVPAKPKESSSSRVLVINKKPYQILAPLGKGGSSKVYLVLNTENELLAVKCVKLSDASESTKNDYLNEIQHLLKMQHSKHVIRLYDHQYLTSQKLLFVVMEKGDTDLYRFLKDKASSDEGISPELIMYYWTEMLLAVKCIHDNNIIHRDLKPANFLLVSGRLKLIDFGIASSIQTEQTSILMESQSGTFNYMSPEALQDLGFDNKVLHKIGRKTDVWSLGCILYYFLYKKTPYQDLVKPLHKMKAITDPNYKVAFPKILGVPDILIESCKRCLIHDTKKRSSIEELLALRNRPLYSLSQVLEKLEKTLSPEEYEKAAKAFEDAD